MGLIYLIKYQSCDEKLRLHVILDVQNMRLLKIISKQTQGKLNLYLGRR